MIVSARCTTNNQCQLASLNSSHQRRGLFAMSFDWNGGLTAMRTLLLCLQRCNIYLPRDLRSALFLLLTSESPKAKVSPFCCPLCSLVDGMASDSGEFVRLLLLLLPLAWTQHATTGEQKCPRSNVHCADSQTNTQTPTHTRVRAHTHVRTATARRRRLNRSALWCRTETRSSAHWFYLFC